MAKKVLEGIRVIDAATMYAAPFMATLLSEFGAEVIKIEQPGGDPVRGTMPVVNGSSLIWKVTNRNKKCITLNFGKDRGIELFHRLLRESDVAIFNFRPSYLKKRSIDYSDLVKVKSDIIMMHLSAYGRTGPYSDKPGFARVVEAFSGLTHITGFPDRKPVLNSYWISDSIAGIYGAFSIMLAIYHHRQTGKGQLVDLGLYEPLIRLMEDYIINYDVLGLVKERIGTASPSYAPDDLYECGDGKFVVLPVVTQIMFKRLTNAFGFPELIDDPRFNTNENRMKNSAELDKYVEGYTRKHTMEEVISVLEQHQIACGKVSNVVDLFNDPHIKERGNLISCFDPGLGKEITMQGVIPVLSETPGQVNWPGPPIGAHNEDIYRGLLKLSGEEYSSLKESGVI